MEIYKINKFNIKSNKKFTFIHKIYRFINIVFKSKSDIKLFIIFIKKYFPIINILEFKY